MLSVRTTALRCAMGASMSTEASCAREPAARGNSGADLRYDGLCC
jgi:hypothetical protein